MNEKTVKQDFFEPKKRCACDECVHSKKAPCVPPCRNCTSNVFDESALQEMEDLYIDTMSRFHL